MRPTSPSFPAFAILFFSTAGGAPIPGLNFTSEAVVYVYNATTGDAIVTCAPQVAGWINDITVKNGKAYATDSFVNYVTELDVATALMGECVVSQIETPADVFLTPEGFKANGES